MIMLKMLWCVSDAEHSKCMNMKHNDTTLFDYFTRTNIVSDQPVPHQKIRCIGRVVTHTYLHQTVYVFTHVHLFVCLLVHLQDYTKTTGRISTKLGRR